LIPICSGPPGDSVLPRSSEIWVFFWLSTKRPLPNAMSAKVGLSESTVSKFSASSVRTTVPGAPQPQVTVLVDGQVVETLAPAAGWQTYRIELPAAATADGLVLVALRSDTFRPRALDRANPDNRELGVMVDSIVLLPR